MLIFVRERFLKIAERHLNEANAWCNAAKNFQDSYAALSYANKKVRDHLDMVKYWHAACDSLHYKPGTWAYKF